MFKNDYDKLDQHFLIDKEVVDKYLGLADIKNSETIVEIGAGKGVLTKYISTHCKKLYVIEIDKRLNEFLKDLDNTTIIYNNVLDIEIPSCDKIITSLPYSIIEPFIKKLINANFKEMYMLMGNNYVDDVLNKKITKLSIITNSYFKVSKLLSVYPSSFDIPPRTLSYLVKVEKSNFEDLDLIYKIYNLLYYYQDKKIKNSLMEALIKIYNLTKKEAKNIIDKLNIPLDILEDKFETISNKNLNVLNKYLVTIMI